MDSETPKEAAKVAKEFAKTARTAIEEPGPWFGKIVGEPTTELLGTLVDQLEYYWAIRAIELYE